ncbi:MAG TPA: hypothetical protein VGP45_03010 [Marinobacter sp.]|nr:hypothetical protein [Marinobacter sp.]
MALRGPKSAAAALTTVAIAPRLKVPDSLPASQQEALRVLIDTKPAAFFNRSDLPLLTQLARHMDRADRFESEVQLLDPEDLEGLKWLATQADRETKAILAIMRSLRLTPQSRYWPDSSALFAHDTGVRPWDTE